MGRVTVPVALFVLLLAGCAPITSADPTPTPTSSQEPADTYSTVNDLRDAFVAAGGACPDWRQTNRVTLAAQSGDCSDSTVLSIYSSEADRDQVVENLKSFGMGVHLLVGENWIVNVEGPEEYADELGGTVVTKPPDE